MQHFCHVRAQINRLEEMHSVNTSVPIDGYHDIRDADVTIKACKQWEKRLDMFQRAEEVPLSFISF